MEELIMSGSIPLIRKRIIELLLQHFDNELISQLLNKAPMKQGLNILPINAPENSKNKVIQILLSEKNLKYIISILESGNYLNVVQGEYDDLHERYSLDGFYASLKETDGRSLDYLIFLITYDKMEGLSNLFLDDPVKVEELSTFLKNEGLDQVKIKKYERVNEEVKDTESEILKQTIIKLQNENKSLKKKIDRNLLKVKRNFEKELTTLNENAEKDQEDQKKNYEKQLENINLELNQSKQELASIKAINDSLITEIEELKELVKEVREFRRVSVLIIGDLPYDFALDEQKYRIITLAKTDRDALEDIINGNEISKIYIQSEYVSTGEYLSIKKRYATIPMEYISIENMKKR